MASSKDTVQKGPLKGLVDILHSEKQVKELHKIINDLEKLETTTQISVEIKISTPSATTYYHEVIYGPFEKRPLTVILKENIPDEYRDELFSLAKPYKNLNELKKEIKKINDARKEWRNKIVIHGKDKIVNKIWTSYHDGGTYRWTTLATIDYNLLEACLKDENVL